MTKDFNYTKAVRDIPKSWNELKYSKYLELMKEFMRSDEEIIKECSEFYMDGFNQINLKDIYIEYKTLSILTDVDISIIKSLPYQYLKPLKDCIDFMKVEYKNVGNCKMRLKNLEEMTYDNFIYLAMIKDDLVNQLPNVVKMISKDEITIEEIMNMSYADLMECFFLFRRSMNKSAMRSILSLAKQVRTESRKQWIKEVMTKVSPCNLIKGIRLKK